MKQFIVPSYVCVWKIYQWIQFFFLLLAAACHVGGSDTQLDYVGGQE